ncbi:ribosomal protein S18-alanine N-acetyltransferase [Leptolyngbya sp. FACHB-261]|uniref:ribosomal protein S18-alanine N-acetyltransferase n=1 Tax=Leptolyngbya sp. FACHB-261 TaxID=2692806 RepID=UPI001683448E|nr:ribosomal protein S18-alanine N-acetyltransferase [Leptolyngbya sp. FACHB-261]MBD2105084.1 ribosomal protein S18-alanine N-acetyltransferase [Leptolyngbya sp. FACHB-261]
MLSTLTLTPLTEACLPQIIALDQVCLGGFWAPAAYQRELASDRSILLGVFAQANLVAMGCLWSIVEEAHITLLAVHPDQRRRGLGSLLLWSLLNQARGLGLAWATLEVRVSNTPALNLYGQYGFKEVGRRRGYYPDTGEDGLVLWRSGLNQPEFVDSLNGQWRRCEINLKVQGWTLQAEPGLVTILRSD